MRGNVPRYEVQSARSVADALELLSRDAGGWRPLAGGTDLMVALETGTLSDRRFIDISRLAELRGIRKEAERLVIGGLTTFSELGRSPVVKSEFPNLAEAARSVGAIAIQNRATLAGNIANASPAADAPPALLSYDAELELISSAGPRWIPYAEFHTGYKKTQMRPDELIQSIALPRPSAGQTHYFRKVGTRAAQAISKVSFAGRASFDGKAVREVRIALGSVAPTVLRCMKTEEALVGGALDAKTLATAKRALIHELSPIDDIRSNAEYRLRVALNLLDEFILTLKRK